MIGDAREIGGHATRRLAGGGRQGERLALGAKMDLPAARGDPQIIAQRAEVRGRGVDELDLLGARIAEGETALAPDRGGRADLGTERIAGADVGARARRPAGATVIALAAIAASADSGCRSALAPAAEAKATTAVGSRLCAGTAPAARGIRGGAATTAGNHEQSRTRRDARRSSAAGTARGSAVSTGPGSGRSAATAAAGASAPRCTVLANVDGQRLGLCGRQRAGHAGAEAARIARASTLTADRRDLDARHPAGDHEGLRAAGVAVRARRRRTGADAGAAHGRGRDRAAEQCRERDVETEQRHPAAAPGPLDRRATRARPRCPLHAAS